MQVSQQKLPAMAQPVGPAALITRFALQIGLLTWFGHPSAPPPAPAPAVDQLACPVLPAPAAAVTGWWHYLAGAVLFLAGFGLSTLLTLGRDALFGWLAGAAGAAALSRKAATGESPLPIAPYASSEHEPGDTDSD